MPSQNKPQQSNFHELPTNMHTPHQEAFFCPTTIHALNGIGYSFFGCVNYALFELPIEKE